MLVLSKMMQIFPVKIRGGGIDGECQSLGVHRQAQHQAAVNTNAVLSAGQGRPAGNSSRAHLCHCPGATAREG